MKDLIINFVLLAIGLFFVFHAYQDCHGYFKQKELNKLQEEKTALEIKILQHELAAYEDMGKELGNEPTIEP